MDLDLYDLGDTMFGDDRFGGLPGCGFRSEPSLALLAFIERGMLALTFGSPGSSTVADGGSTLMLLGSSFGVLAYLARRRKALAKE